MALDLETLQAMGNKLREPFERNHPHVSSRMALILVLTDTRSNEITIHDVTERSSYDRWYARFRGIGGYEAELYTIDLSCLKEDLQLE